MMLTAQANVRIEDVQQVLRTDAAFTADVLRLANSPLIGVRGGITSVMQAVMMLGLERIKGLGDDSGAANLSDQRRPHRRPLRVLET